MPTLSEQFDTALGDVNISVTVDGEVQKLLTIAELVTQLIDSPPDELGDFLTLLSEIDLPEYGFSDDLITSFDDLQTFIPADIATLNSGLLEKLDNLEGTALSGISDVIEPALNAINAFVTLFQGNISCGLIGGFNGAPAAGDAPAAEPPPVPPPAPVPGEPNPGPQQPAVTQQQIDDAKAIVDLLPSPLTVETLLPWLAEFWGNHKLPYNVLRAIPILDDLRGPLATMASWQAMSGGDIINSFATTLSQASTLIEQNSQLYINQRAQQLNNLLAQLDSTLLANAADELAAGFDSIQLAVEGGDLSGIDPVIAAINSAVGDLQAQHLIWSGNLQQAFTLQLKGLADLPDELEDRLVQLISLLQPRPSLQEVFGDNLPAILDTSEADPAGMETLFAEVQTFLENVLDAIDLAALFEPISQPFEEAETVVEEINQLLVGLTLEVQNRLGSLNDAIDAIDLSAVQTETEQTIEDFSNQVQSTLSDQFQPVRDALATILTTLQSAIDDFDPASLQGDIQHVIDTITGVFDTPEVQQALQQLQQLTAIGDSIDSISFTPLTDTVIQGIDEVKAALDSIDESTLDPPLPQMLGSAMSVLPDDVQPLTDPLVDKLGDLIEAGPINLINQIKHIPAQLFDQVRQYDPETLLGDTLSKPYQEVLDKAQQFTPEQLLETLDEEFEQLKERIKNTASPGQALQALVALHQQLAQDLAQLNPGALIEPLDQKIQSLTQALAGAIDIDAILQPLSNIIETINRQTDQIKKGLDLVDHLLAKLDDLSDADAQIDNWIDNLFAKMPDGMDISALTTPLSDLSAAITNTQSANLQLHFASEFSPIDSVLTQLNASQRLNQLVQSVTGIARSEVEALPESPQKTALLNLLDSFTVTDETISGVLQQLANITTVRAELDADLDLKFEHWDERYHRTGGALDNFNQPAVDLVQIKIWLREAIDRQFAWPLRAVLGKVTVLKDIIAQFSTLLNELVAEIDNKIASLLAAPQAIVDLGNSIQTLIDSIAGINLDFLQNSINDIFDTVREKFNDLNPAPIQQSLDENFEEIIDSLNMELIIPADSFADLTASMDALLLDLQGLNPDTLLVEPLQQAFEESIQPFIDSLDVTPLLDAVVARLTPLEDELRGEMERVNTAYQAMLAAAPDTSISIDVSIGF